MKRTILVTIMLLFAGLTVYAQQTGTTAVSSAQIKQNAQQTLTQAKSNSSQFESTMDALNALNGGNIDAGLYEKLKAQIDRLEAEIKNEQTDMQARLDKGTRVSSFMVDKIQRMIDQYNAAIADLERFVAR
jgi:cob(I)alamin adenosyltransferase